MRGIRTSFEVAARFAARQGRLWGLVACALVAVAAIAVAMRAGKAGAADAHAEHAAHADHSDEAMRAEAEAYWANRTPVGADAGEVEGGPAVTITVGDFIFETGAPGQIDTARIVVGESVMWQWVSGFHTITSGMNSGDPNAGLLFDQPSDSFNPQFTFTFNNAGVFPYFCAFHEFQNMFGYVEVTEPASVPPDAGGILGFARDPAPNPTSAGVTFRYALREAGRVRAEVFDANGRRVATLLDRDMPAGVHAAAWSGLTPGGPADTGVYYVRLRLPGYDESRRVVIRR